MVAALVWDLSLSNLFWVNLNLNGNASSVLMCTSVSPRLLPGEPITAITADFGTRLSALSEVDLGPYGFM